MPKNTACSDKWPVNAASSRSGMLRAMARWRDGAMVRSGVRALGREHHALQRSQIGWRGHRDSASATRCGERGRARDHGLEHGISSGSKRSKDGSGDAT